MAFISFDYSEKCKQNNRTFYITLDDGHPSGAITQSLIKSVEAGEHNIRIDTTTKAQKFLGGMQEVYASKSDTRVGRAFYESAAKNSKGETWAIPVNLGDDDALIVYFPGKVGDDLTFETVTLSGEEIKQYMIKINAQEVARKEQEKLNGNNAVKALLLWLFLGWLGLHRRCLNRKWNILYPLTLGCFFILPFIDLFTMIIPAFVARNK